MVPGPRVAASDAAGSAGKAERPVAASAGCPPFLCGEAFAQEGLNRTSGPCGLGGGSAYEAAAIGAGIGGPLPAPGRLLESQIHVPVLVRERRRVADL